MPTMSTSVSFLTASRRSPSRSLLKRPVTRCLRGWTSEARRLMTARRRIISAPLVGLEDRAFDQFVHQASDAAPMGLSALDDAGEVVAVAEGDVAAGGVAGQLLHEILQEAAAVRGEQRLELGDAGERVAVGHRARGIDPGPQLEADADEGVDGAARSRVAGADRAVAVALAADHVESFEREPRRIDF